MAARAINKVPARTDDHVRLPHAATIATSA